MADAQRILDILLRTKSTGDTKPLVRSLTDIKAGIDMAAMAYQQIAQVASEAYNEIITKTVDYNLSIRNMAQNLGLATDETSRIVQAMDDFGVGQEQLQTALALAVKNGFAPSIESIAALADEYNNIQDPVERAAILTEKFGRNWSVLTPALREGGDAIRAAAAGIGDGLIVTDDAAQAAEDYRRALDGLNDSITAIKVQLGNEFIPIMTEALSLFGRIGEMTDTSGMNSGIAWQAALLEKEKEKLYDVRVQMEAIKDLDMAGPIGKTNAAVLETVEQVDAAAEAFEKLGFLVSGEITQDFESYETKQKETTEKLEELKTKLEETSTRTPWKTDDIAALKAEIDGLNGSLVNNKVAFDEANRARIFGIIQDKLAKSDLPEEAQSAALMALARDLGLINEKEAALWNQTDGWAAALGDAAEAAMNTGQEIENIPSYKLVVIDIITYGLGAAKRAIAATGASGNVAQKQRASGGPVSAGEPYIVGEEGPEIFVPGASGQIVPNRGGRGRGSAGTGRSIVINGNVSVTAKDRSTFAQLMEEFAGAGK